MRDRANRPNADEMIDRLDNVFTIPVQGTPPIKDGGTSCLQPGHRSYKPSLDLVRALGRR